MQKLNMFLVIGLILGVIAFCANPVIAGTIQQQIVQESTIEQIMKRGMLRVGMSTFVPWAMKDKTGKLIGFEIDVARQLADDMGVKVEFVPTKWAGIIPSLLTGKFDVIIGGMGNGMQRRLAAKGIEAVITSQTDPDASVAAWLDGTLENIPPEAGHHHHDRHGHGHDGHAGGSTCGC